MLLRFAPAVVAIGLATSVAGCARDTHILLDGGPPPDGPAALATLSVVGPTSLTLGLGERRSVEVLLRDAAGAALFGETVSFSLDGTPGDASIDTLEATTDAAGMARVGLVAGTMPATFRLRVAHPRARLVFVDVSVGAAFGTLRVEPRYAGTRALAETIVHVITDRGCAAALESPGGGRERALAIGAREVELTALPLGLVYTVLVRGISGSGALYAVGCLDGVELMPDLPTNVAVTLTDTALGYDGRYLLRLSLDASGAVASAAGSSELGVALGGGDGDAERLVEALAATLEAQSHPGEAADLRAAAGSAATSLAAALDAEAAAPSAELVARVVEAETIVGTLELGGWMSIGITGEPTIRIGDLVLGGPDTTVALDAAAHLGATPELTSTLDQAAGTLRLTHLALDAPLGALLVAVARARAEDGGGRSLARALDVGACGALAAFVASQPAIAAVCDAACASLACDAALAATVSVLDIEATALDERRARVVLAGVLVGGDTDGDAHNDRFTGDVGGRWEPVGAGAGGDVAGALSAMLGVP